MERNMGNDNKMKIAMKKEKTEILPDTMSNEHRSEVMLFLKDELQPLSHDKPHAYDLTTEYEKTKKNRSSFIWILMVACFIVVACATYGISRYVDYRNNNLKVNIDVFSDLNLRNLLDIVSETKEKLNVAVREKSDLESSFSAEGQRAQRKRDADLFTLQSLNLSKKETKKRQTAIESEYLQSMQTIHESYDAKIAKQDSLIKQYQQQLDAYDSSKVEQAQQQEAAIDSAKQLYEIEKQQDAARYEKLLADLRDKLSLQQQQDFESQKKAVNDVKVKYQKEINALDPVITDRTDLVTKASGATHNGYYEWSLLAQQLPQNISAEYRNAVADVSSSYADFAQTQKIVTAIPQQNSIPSFVKAMTQFAYHAGNTIVSASVTEVNRLSAQNIDYQDKLVAAEADKKKALQAAAAEKAAVEEQSAVYQSYLQTVCEQNQCDGMLVSLSKTTKLPVYLAQGARVYFTDAKYKDLVVKGNFMRNGAKVAAVTVSSVDGMFYCTTDDLTAGGRVRVGDLLVIDKPQNANTVSQ
jgi:hypothetical protein